MDTTVTELDVAVAAATATDEIEVETGVLAAVNDNKVGVLAAAAVDVSV